MDAHRFRLEGVEHDLNSLGPEARELAQRLAFVQRRLHDLHNQQALLTKARNAYIADLKAALDSNLGEHDAGRYAALLDEE